MPSRAGGRAGGLGLTLLLVLYFVIGGSYAAYTPPWQVPDEPAHYNYIRQLAETGRLPLLRPGDYDQAYLSELTATGFPPDKPVDSLRYENHQPPLYYLLALPAFAAAGGALLPLRLFSLAVGAGVTVFAYLIALTLFPGRTPLALTVAGFIAFLPQHMAMMAGVNNDGLAELLIAIGLWLLLRVRRDAARSRLALGIVVGAAFLTKATAYVLAPVVACGLLLAARRENWGWRRLASEGARVFLPALFFGGLWWARNLAVYGWPDFLGLARHAVVVVGQPRTEEWLAELGWGEYLRRFFVTTFRSFWGQFGWMGVVMDGRVYWVLLAFTAVLAAGLAYAFARRKPLTPVQRDSLFLLCALALLVASQYVYYNFTFVQHQGRYLFPALVPLALGAAAGLKAWSRLGAPYAVPLTAIALLAALDLFALFRFIIPALPRY